MLAIGPRFSGYTAHCYIFRFTAKHCCQKVGFSYCTSVRQIEFGILCDVDGVISRGRSVIPAGLEATELLCDQGGKWRAPIVFFTNAGNMLRKTKAAEISEMLRREVLPTEIVMSHTALRFYSDYFDKHVVICGHGPVKDIARNIGFKRCSTIEEISSTFPWLDACKPREKICEGDVGKNSFEKVEAIILFGEPERWEQSLQIIIDLLLQNGDLSKAPEGHLSQVDRASHSHLPVFACSSDLVWASSAPTPRIAHGGFLSCLETLYKRMSGQCLTYSGLVGKPSPLAYTFALSQLNAIASKNFGATKPLKRVYCIGDNPEVDVYGANLYNMYLQSMPEETLKALSTRVDFLVKEAHPSLFPCTPLTEPAPSCMEDDDRWKQSIESLAMIPQISGDSAFQKSKRVAPCTLESILVLTGVYQEHRKPHRLLHSLYNSRHRVHPCFPYRPTLCEPRYVARDVADAVDCILHIEGLSNRGGVDVTPCCPYLDEVIHSP